ncbi:MAG: hypothetical protein WD638_04405 [Nitriliruptoraceae bacterium]
MPSDPRLLHVDDAGFVRAPEALVYRRLTHLERWPAWWPGTRMRPMVGAGADERWIVSWRGAPGRRLRVVLRPYRWRHDLGFAMQVDGDLRGRAEFWLEPAASGTIVHHVLAATTALPRPRQVVADHRRAIRRGLWGLKDTLQLEARTSAGLDP